MLASNIRARVEAHTPLLLGQFALFLSQPPIPNTLGGLLRQSSPGSALQGFSAIFVVLCVKKYYHLIMGKRCSFVLAGSDVEDGMSSEVEKGS